MSKKSLVVIWMVVLAALVLLPAAGWAQEMVMDEAVAADAAADDGGGMGLWSIIAGSGWLGIILWTALLGCSVAAAWLAIDFSITVNPKKIIPVAVVSSVIGIGVFYVLVSWLAIVGTGPQNAIALAQDSATAGDIFFTPVHEHLGPWAVDLFKVLLMTGSFACGMAFHNCAARYLYAVGRENVIPGMRRLAHVKANLAASDAGPLPAELMAELRKHRWVRLQQPQA